LIFFTNQYGVGTGRYLTLFEKSKRTSRDLSLH
jgi:hypothetical protein